jgi:mannose/fructose/N-acetylgalactosamine-specific phosphotransferase system component IIC
MHKCLPVLEDTNTSRKYFLVHILFFLAGFMSKFVLKLALLAVGVSSSFAAIEASQIPSVQFHYWA